MSDVQTTPAKRSYTPRQSNAERMEGKREALLRSIPPVLSDDLKGRAQRQAKAAEAEALKASIAAMDDLTPDNVRRGAQAALQKMLHIAEPAAVEMVAVTVRRKGAGKISMGVHEPPFGEVYFEAGERVELPAPTAKIYGPDGKDWVEFDGD